MSAEIRTLNLIFSYGSPWSQFMLFSYIHLGNELQLFFTLNNETGEFFTLVSVNSGCQSKSTNSIKDLTLGNSRRCWHGFESWLW